MKLKEIVIKNFRSLKDVTITMDKNCIILLGKNEAGKSNILNALATVLGVRTVTAQDRRKRIGDEVITAYEITAVITMNSLDHEKVLNLFYKKYKGVDLIKFKNGMGIDELIKKTLCEILIDIEIDDNKKPIVRYWEPKTSDFIIEQPISLSGATFSLTSKKNSSLLAQSDDISDSITLGGLLEKIFEVARELYYENPYICHFWQYKDEYLLQNKIKIEDFMNSPDRYVPLQNIFTMCNRRNIKEEFINAKKQDSDYNNLLEQVSKTITKKIKEIWRDFGKTSIKLSPDGEHILIKVCDAANYSFADRSDGFKKIISILLMLSTRARSGLLNDRDIILIDEPDQSLYPSSARYLRDELLKISEKTIVVYTTHSQYMIDSNCVERHLIVEKNDSSDITIVKKPSLISPFADDELLRNAIGSSVFECLRDKNIIFEGWLDKELFVKYKKFHKLDNTFKNIGYVYSSGMSGAFTLIELLLLANKKFIIISDSDHEARSRHKSFNEKFPLYKNCWIEYVDIDSKILTLEDFFDENYISTTIDSLGYAKFIYNNTQKAIENIEVAVLDVDAKQKKECKQNIKNKLVELSLKKHIKNNYIGLINELKKRYAL